MTPAVLPGAGERVDIKSTRGSRVYENCEVIGVGHSARGNALWVWISGTDRGILGPVHAYIPLDEIESWDAR